MGRLELRTVMAKIMTKFWMHGEIVVDPANLAMQAGPRPTYQNLISHLSDGGEVAFIPTPFYSAFPTTFFIKD